MDMVRRLPLSFFSENSNIEIINFQLATDSINIDEEGLLFTLRYISENINVDLINISCGITYLYNYKLLDINYV